MVLTLLAARSLSGEPTCPCNITGACSFGTKSLLCFSLSGDKIQQLIDTRQILALRITGEERFDSIDIDRLIDTYKTTASRRIQ